MVSHVVTISAPFDRSITSTAAEGVEADYEVGRGTAVLFLSVAYHAMHPQYIYARVADVARANYKLRILLVHVCPSVSQL